MTRVLALDTSVAVPLVLRAHTHHELVRTALSDAEVHLTGHSLAETYAVLTRLPGDARLTASDAHRLINDRFAPAYLIPARTARTLPTVLATLGITGGATYDALVGLAAKAGGAQLATRDGRAAATYRAVGVDVELIVDA